MSNLRSVLKEYLELKDSTIEAVIDLVLIEWVEIIQVGRDKGWTDEEILFKLIGEPKKTKVGDD